MARRGSTTISAGAGRPPARWPWLLAIALAAAVLGPALRPGYLLRFDLVSVPDPVLGDDALGLGDRLPRAVPWDSAVALLAAVLPDSMIAQLAALAALVGVGVGAARLAAGLAGVRAAGQALALVVAIWNPFVAEQLAIGHVPHLLGYAALPWAGLAAWAVMFHGAGPWPTPRRWALLALPVAAGSLTPGGGLLCLVTIAAVVARALLPARSDAGLGARRGQVRRAALALGTAAALQAPWLVAGITHPAAGDTPTAAADAVTAFAVRGQSPAGVVVDTLGLGGMWARGALPASRVGPLALIATVVLLGLAALGASALARGRRGRDPGSRAGLAVLVGLGVAGYLIALLPHLPGGRALLQGLIATVPGAGILRDGHRWLAWPALLVAVLCAAAAQAMADRSAGRLPAAAAGIPVLLAGVVVAGVPDLAGGLAGRLRPASFPADWTAVRQLLDTAPDTDRVVLLPWQPFRRFAWAGPASVLDPAPRMLPRPTLADDALTVGGVRLPAEGIGSRRLGAAITDGILDAAELRAVGAGWVLVAHGTPGVVPALPSGARAVHAGPDLTLLRLPDAVATASAPTQRVAVLSAHLVALALVLAAAGTIIGTSFRRRVAGLRRHGSRERGGGPAPATVPPTG